MSSATWTPAALASEARRIEGGFWRMVEAQHQASTLKLVDNAAEQALLESLLEASKPPLPDVVAHLDYLLATPFRYPPPQRGSRFRAPTDPGVFYAAEDIPTAAAELGWWRWRFLTDSAGMSRIDPVAHTAFQALIAADGIDLTQPPLDADTAQWMAPDDYRATQALAAAVRAVPLQAIRYASVRHPDQRACIALIDPAGFAAPRPDPATQTWWLAVDAHGAHWVREGERVTFWFDG
jgi:hypothetical protein